MNNEIFESINNKIQNEISQNKDDFVLSLGDFTPFKWNECFVFYGSYSNEEVGKILKLNYSDQTLESEGIHIIFVYEHKIAYQEYSSDNRSTGIQFNKVNNNDVVPHFTTQNSKFRVTVQETYKGSGKVFYNLTPIVNKISK